MINYQIIMRGFLRCVCIWEIHMLYGHLYLETGLRYPLVVFDKRRVLVDFCVVGWRLPLSIGSGGAATTVSGNQMRKEDIAVPGRHSVVRRGSVVLHMLGI